MSTLKLSQAHRAVYQSTYVRTSELGTPLTSLMRIRLLSQAHRAVYQLVWLARPSHLIAGALRAGKGRSSGSND